MPRESAEVSARSRPRRRLRGPLVSRATAHDGPDVETVSLTEEAHIAHEEARMVLPGIQALFGFQLIVVFGRPFFDLVPSDRYVHLAALLLVAIAIGLIVAPAAFHRLAEPNVISSRWIRLASRQITWAMAALMIAIGLDVYLVARMIAGPGALALAVGVAASAVLAWLWFALPWLQRPRGGRAARR